MYNRDFDNSSLEEKFLADAELNLQNSEFGLALENFKKVLAINDQNHEAHWGIVLSEHQVKRGENFSLNATLDADVHCQLAILCAGSNNDFSSKEEYERCYHRQTLCALLKFLIAKSKNDYYLMKKWKEHYINSSCANTDIKTAIGIIFDKEKLTEFEPLIPGAFLIIYEKSGADGSFTEITEKIKELAWAEYDNYMQRIFYCFIHKNINAFAKARNDDNMPKISNVSSKEICDIVRRTFGDELCTKERTSGPTFFHDLDYYRRAVEEARSDLAKFGTKILTEEEILEMRNQIAIAEKLTQKDFQEEIDVWIDPKKDIFEEYGININVNVDKDLHLNTCAARYLHIVYSLARIKEFFNEEQYLEAIKYKPSESELEYFWDKMVELAEENNKLCEYIIKYYKPTPKIMRNLLYLKANNFTLKEVKINNVYVGAKSPLTIDNICEVNHNYIKAMNDISQLLSIENDIDVMISETGEYQLECTEKWNDYLSKINEMKKQIKDAYLKIMHTHAENCIKENKRHIVKWMFMSQEKRKKPIGAHLFMDVYKKPWTEVTINSSKENARDNCVVTDINITVGQSVKEGETLYKTTKGSGIAPKDGVVVAMAYEKNEAMPVCRPACYII